MISKTCNICGKRLRNYERVCRKEECQEKYAKQIEIICQEIEKVGVID